MAALRYNFLATGCLVSLLVGCAAAPTTDTPAEPVAAESVPAEQAVTELTLNLPDGTEAQCNCTSEASVDRTFLDKGFSALAAGDHREAINYFRRYQRLESSPAVDWEAGIAIAYDKMLPGSPYYNWRAARESYLRLMRNKPEGVELNQQVVLWREALEILSDLHWQINDLQKENDIVTENLEKREEALRRLRELTLGQKVTAQ